MDNNTAVVLIIVVVGTVMFLNTLVRAWRDRGIAKAAGSDPIAERERAESAAKVEHEKNFWSQNS